MEQRGRDTYGSLVCLILENASKYCLFRVPTPAKISRGIGLPTRRPADPTPALEHLVNAPTKKRWNSGPAPPKQSQENGRSNGCIGRPLVPKNEHDYGNREDDKQNARNSGEKKQKKYGPERDLWLRHRQFMAPAAGACFRIACIRMQLRTELHVITPAAKVAEERLADSAAIAVITILHRSVIETLDALHRQGGATRETGSHR
jgi:hypothetical protein